MPLRKTATWGPGLAGVAELRSRLDVLVSECDAIERVDESEQLRGALRLWLEWNELHEAVTARLYEARHDAHQLETLLDQLDEVRQRAVFKSRQLLSGNGP